MPGGIRKLALGLCAECLVHGNVTLAGRAREGCAGRPWGALAGDSGQRVRSQPRRERGVAGA